MTPASTPPFDYRLQTVFTGWGLTYLPVTENPQDMTTPALSQMIGPTPTTRLVVHGRRPDAKECGLGRIGISTAG